MHVHGSSVGNGQQNRRGAGALFARSLILGGAAAVWLSAVASFPEKPQNDQRQEVRAQEPQENRTPAVDATKGSGYRDLEASLGLLPGLIESADAGPFVDFVKALDDVYPGSIHIHVYPFARSTHNVATGAADFHLPAIRDIGASEPDPDLPLASVDEVMGKFSLVLYSNVNRKLSLEQIREALALGGEFPYHIEGIATGVKKYIKIPFEPSFSIEASLQRVNAQRIDGFFHTPEGTDAIVIAQKLKHIHRSQFESYYDVISIQKSARGEEVNRILSDCIRKLRKSGRLQELYSRIHKPYDDWQPAEMGW